MTIIVNFKTMRVPRSEAAHLTEVLERGWVYVHSFIAALPDNEEGMATLAHMVALEQQGRKREHITHRLYRAFAQKRRDTEERVLYA